MKLNNKNILASCFAILAMGTMSTSCTDKVAFGNSFLDKAPGGDATIDTVFTNAEYTRRFVTKIYTYQYYGLPTRSSTSKPRTSSYWMGMFEGLSDCYHFHYLSSEIYKYYYSGTLSATQNVTVYPYKEQYLWETLRAGYIFLDNVERCTEMESTERNRLSAETKCLMAQSYFNMFRFYGGLPIITKQYTGTESEYSFPRGTVEECVNYMIGLLDEAINTPELPFAYTGDEAQTETGRWTRGAAMALKIRILQFAASPLFNSDQPYYGGQSEAEQQRLVWYGNYDKSRWTALKKACEEFFAANEAAGSPFHMVEAETTGNPEEDQVAYRHAYREGYLPQGSPEVIHSVRPESSSQWLYLRTSNDRLSYTPTQEYVEMFPWSDGTPFNWDDSKALPDKDDKSLQHMFLKGDTVASKQLLQHRILTRDPRLYENVACNGVPQVSDMNTGEMENGEDYSSGATTYENWCKGASAGDGPLKETGGYATGYCELKYCPGPEYSYSGYKDKKEQWAYLRYDDMLLTYAEALLQADDNFAGCIKYIDEVRARVGLKGLVESNPDKNLTSNKDNLLEELLRERACELGFEGSRYMDIVRYKRTDLLSKQLHGLRIYRQVKDANGNWIDSQTPWYKKDADGAETTRSTKKGIGFYEPSYFRYEKFDINNRARAQWTNWDNKWLLQPFPNTEILMGYGLIQNPGW